MSRITITLSEQNIANLEALKSQDRFQALKAADIVTQLIAENLEVNFELPKNISENKNDLKQFKINLYLTQPQVDFLESQGKQFGFNTLAKVIKFLVLSQLNPNKTLSPDNQQALREFVIKINAIGKNINQISKALNNTNIPSSEMLTKIQDYLAEALPQLEKNIAEALQLAKEGSINAK